MSVEDVLLYLAMAIMLVTVIGVGLFVISELP